ncbi:TolC family protein [Algoriphagus sp. Y33]|uniref:TolC family protein n=1 Tax=Algoriphagus sp. Y33 TaxID=2772483 RepID=UPI001781DC67|nr:TolC family protein [Algoriphagus sp. Y33]
MRIIYSILVLLAFAYGNTATAQEKTFTLEECRNLALANNKQIKSAIHSIDAANEGLASTKASALPSVEGSITAVHLGDPLSTLLPSEMINGGLDIKQNIYSGGKVNYGKQTAAKTVELYESQKTMTEAEVLLSVETSYWQLVQATERIAVANKYRDMLKELRQEFQNSVDAGMTFKNDLLRAEVNLNNAELSIIQANDALILHKLTLAQLIGQPGNIEYSVLEALDYDYMPIVESGSIENRPELAILNKSLEIDELQAKILKANQLPQIGASLSGITAFGDGANFSSGKNQLYTYYGMVNVSIPIFNWGKNKSKVREQYYKIDAAKAELEDNRELFNLEMVNAQMRLNQSFKKIKLSEVSLKQSDENLRLANDRFSVGTITGNDMLEAQVIWEQAVLSLVDAKSEYMINLASYKRATGSLITNDQ